MKYARRDARIYTDLEPIDRNDPEGAATAIEYGLPESFSSRRAFPGKPKPAGSTFPEPLTFSSIRGSW